MNEKHKHLNFPENLRLLKFRDGTEVWAQSKRIGEGKIQLNLEIFPPRPDPFNEARLKSLSEQLLQLATSRGWPKPQLKSWGRPTTIFFTELPESEMETVSRMFAEPQ